MLFDLLRMQRSRYRLSNAGAIALTPNPTSISPATGPSGGGTSVTIKGNHLGGATSVTFAGVAATNVVAVDDGTVTCTTPAGTPGASVDVIVFTRAGAGTFATAFTYAAAVPTVTSVSPNLGDTAGGGQLVTITGTNFTGATLVKFAGVAATNLTVVNATTITCTPPNAGAVGLVNVTVTAPGGTGTGTNVFEYWNPTSITGVDGYWDANEGVTQSGGLVSQWLDQTSNAIAAVQATGANKPVQTASVFGSLPSLRFTPQQWLAFASRSGFTTGASFFFVGRWNGSTTVSSNPTITPAYCAIGNDSGGVQNQFGAAGGAIEYHANNGSWQTITRGAGLNDNVPHLCGVTHDTSGNVKLYVGATQQGATQGGITYDTSFENYEALGVGYTDVDGWSGDIGAIIAVKAIISAGDLAKLNTWSQQRWGSP